MRSFARTVGLLAIVILSSAAGMQFGASNPTTALRVVSILIPVGFTAGIFFAVVFRNEK